MRNPNVLAICILAICSIFATAQPASGQVPYDEPWRPQYHFTPPKNFMNDPNGMVFYKGEYHLFYQYNPEGTVWGHMSWGHAVSTDMLHWQNLPIAIPEEPGKYMIYSGSAVVDWQNSSGFCANTELKDRSCLIAVYTAAGKDIQNQHVAFSNDRGRTWTNYTGNPVVNLGQADFRDPKVFWYAPQKKWVMVAVFADERIVKILDSRDLKTWKVQSSFGPAGTASGQWECPDLFELQVEGSAKTKKWVLIVNRNPGAPAGGTGVSYFIGTFDGKTFSSETPKGDMLWADSGKDFYATNRFSDLGSNDPRTIWIGWIGNWQYANVEPTEKWRGAQSIPRTLSLKRYQNQIRLAQSPIEETEKLRQRQWLYVSALSVGEANRQIKQASARGETLEIEAELAPEDAKEMGLRLRKGPTEETLVGISTQEKTAFIDRTRSGMVSFSKEFAGRHAVGLQGTSKVRLHIFLDRSSVEVFVNDGEAVLTDRIYPSARNQDVEIYANSDRARVLSLSVWDIQSVWGHDAVKP
ncbi:MAG: levanase [Candidatus Acidiferrum sp.]